ncbi:MAG: SseB family protein [Pirellulaceae bacterium]|nr:SseB family protein [Pirellulaceae bacterium]
MTYEHSFSPVNQLEIALLDAKEGRISIQSFWEVLLQSTIFLSSSTEIDSNGMGLKPLLFDRDEETLVAVFTSPERMARFGRISPFCVAVKGQWICEHINTSFGIVLNPGSTVGFELPAVGVRNVYRSICRS